MEFNKFINIKYLSSEIIKILNYLTPLVIILSSLKLNGYVISFVILLMTVLISGLDLETAFSSVGACLNNLGPGLGLVSENYSEINSFAKGVLAFSMLLGRLEIFTLLIILTPLFWAK